jgi:hypothetical protein
MNKFKIAYRATHTGVVFSAIVVGTTMLTLVDITKSVIISCMKPFTRMYLRDMHATYGFYIKSRQIDNLKSIRAIETTKGCCSKKHQRQYTFKIDSNEDNTEISVNPVVFESAKKRC